ncbi:hypothetical protein ASD31_24890 [Rhizobium sp. Root482]|nr:hypothetical protein ASD31_24890 [Rhizobium sp. Root482]
MQRLKFRSACSYKEQMAEREPYDYPTHWMDSGTEVSAMLSVKIVSAIVLAIVIGIFVFATVQP